MNKEQLEGRKAELAVSLKQQEANLHATDGALQEVIFWLAQLEAEEQKPKDAVKNFKYDPANAVLNCSAMTQDEFEEQYAKRSGTTVDWLHSRNQFGSPCNCGEVGCLGWQMNNISELQPKE